jgi:hypothetical protein
MNGESGTPQLNPPPEPQPIPQPAPEPNSGTESSFFGVSVRAWVTLAIVLTGCAMALMKMEIVDPMYSLLLIVLSFYFGQKSAKPSTG